MTKCTATDEPLISILLASYNPRLDWLEEQLCSLEKQTYPHLKLYFRDDCSSDVPFAEIESLVKRCITRFPVELAQNAQNIGSDKTFERLTNEAEGDYFAYCDQDDIWLPDKLRILEETIRREKAVLVCSDTYIIDQNGDKIANSITDIRKRHVFHSGEGLAPYLLVRNFVIGCTMLVKADIAKNAVPFVEGYVHDQWIAAYAALHGIVYSLPQPLIRYRQHGNNQTGILTGISTKNDYLENRICHMERVLKRVEKRLTPEQAAQAELPRLQQSFTAREEYYRKPGLREMAEILRIDEISRASKLLELLLPFLSERQFSRCVKLAKKGSL